MPPKAKLTREDIIAAAVALVRESGVQAINARALAAHLGCSTQPVFSNFASMEELRETVIREADALSTEYVKREIESGRYPPYKASGIAYIRFAREERELFKLLYMRDRSGEQIPEYHELTERMNDMVHRNTGLADDEAKLFHLEMWAYVHGIAVMFATGFFDLEWTLVEKMLTDSYLGLRKQYGMEDTNGSHTNRRTDQTV